MSQKPLAKMHLNEQTISLSWQVGHMANDCLRPIEYYSATVPGAVQRDYMLGKGLAHFSIGTNVEAYRALEEKFWCYQTTFSQPKLADHQELVFYAQGIDYEFDIILNGKKLLHQEGMFTPVRLNLSDHLQSENTLEVVIYPAPLAPNEPFGRRQAIMSVKPPVNYSWDWHPRLITLGIWDDVSLVVADKAQILATDFSYQLNQALSQADIQIHCDLTAAAVGKRLNIELLDAENNAVISSNVDIEQTSIKIPAQLTSPNLWWSHDHGVPYLYRLRIQLECEDMGILDLASQRVGFRKVELVMNAGTWEEVTDFPKSQSAPPFTLKLNNRVIYAKGSNWVHPEVFYGTITRKRYQEQLEMVTALNMNIVRIWGGGITNKEAFHELCDEMGIMLWQEFPLACNPYTNDAHYLDILEQEARSIISRVRQHPSLVMWSGGNELFNDWSGMTEQSHPLRLLNSLCYQLDRDTPYIHTSPIYGVGHGHYLFYDKDEQKDVFQRMHEASNTAYTEFGMPSLAPMEVLKSIIPEEELFPVTATPAWVVHGGFEAWQPGSWSEIATIEKYFGKAGSLEQLVEQSQILQAIGYKAIFEEGRRQQPYCSMVLNWCLNEPWPTAANNSLIAYPNIKKPAFYAVQASLRSVLASAKFTRFDYQAGQQLAFDLWMLNDSYQQVSCGNIDVFITLGNTEIKIGAWEYEGLQANINLEGPKIKYRIPVSARDQLASIRLSVQACPQYDSEYRILIHATENKEVDVNRLNF